MSLFFASCVCAGCPGLKSGEIEREPGQCTKVHMKTYRDV